MKTETGADRERLAQQLMQTQLAIARLSAGISHNVKESALIGVHSHGDQRAMPVWIPSDYGNTYTD